MSDLDNDTRYADEQTLAYIAQLEAENATLKEQLTEVRADVTFWNTTFLESREEYERQLIAIQHRIKQLREALEALSHVEYALDVPLLQRRAREALNESSD